MTKVVINNCYGGFGLSDEAAEWLIEQCGWSVTQWDDGEYADSSADLIDTTAGLDGRDEPLGGRYSIVGDRDDPELRTRSDLIELVEGKPVSPDGRHASLKVVEIPDDVDWKIKEYDGSEWVAETHRTWG